MRTHFSNNLFIQWASCSTCIIFWGKRLKLLKCRWQNPKVKESIFQKHTSSYTDKNGDVTTSLLFRITSKTVSSICVSWAEPGPSCVKPLRLMSMNVRTAESPLALGEMKPSAVSFSLLQYEGQKKQVNGFSSTWTLWSTCSLGVRLQQPLWAMRRPMPRDMHREASLLPRSLFWRLCLRSRLCPE